MAGAAVTKQRNKCIIAIEFSPKLSTRACQVISTVGVALHCMSLSILELVNTTNVVDCALLCVCVWCDTEDTVWATFAWVFFLHETTCLDLLHKSQFFETKRYCCDGTGSQPPDRQTSSIPKHVAAFLVYSWMLWCEAITITLRWHTLICRSAHITYGCRSVR